MQIDTTNILFICGGAFDGLDKIVSNRIGKKVMGFGADIKSKNAQSNDEVMGQVKPEDLIKPGLILEFVGRLPVVVTFRQLDEAALVKILTEPRNALVKQYQRLLEMDGVELSFTDEALRAIADLAIKRKSGARGLRAIIEGVMLDTMYELPSKDAVRKCIITEQAVRQGVGPDLIEGEPAVPQKRRQLQAREKAPKPEPNVS